MSFDTDTRVLHLLCDDNLPAVRIVSPNQQYTTKLQCDVRNTIQIKKIIFNEEAVPAGYLLQANFDITQNGQCVCRGDIVDPILDLTVERGSKLVLTVNWSSTTIHQKKTKKKRGNYVCCYNSHHISDECMEITIISGDVAVVSGIEYSKI